MFYYIDQPCTPSFPIGLVKTESNFFFRSVETGLGRWMLVVPEISVDTYPFFGFLRPDLRPDLSPWGYRNSCFLVALYHLIVGRLKLEVVTKSQKYRGSFSAMLHMEVCPYSYFQWCWYFWGLQVSFVMTDEFSVRVTKITSRIGVAWTHSLPFSFWPIFNSINYGHIIKKM